MTNEGPGSPEYDSGLGDNLFDEAYRQGSEARTLTPQQTKGLENLLESSQQGDEKEKGSAASAG